MKRHFGFLTGTTLGIASLFVQAAGASALAGPESDQALLLESKRIVLETTTQISPPAIQFSGRDTIRLAWFEKNGTNNEVKLARLTDGNQAPALTITVNRPGQGPAAIHQAPGLAVGREGSVFVTWSASNKGAGGLFASDLLLARSTDGGVTFVEPAMVNDDGKPISHTFEDLLIGPDGNVYLSWLDGRAKDRSGAAAFFACSQDQGRSIGKNVMIDGMACPCCRPAVASAPDGTIWV
ncbi:MAG TPA: sialidase family protein, partial [Nitrospiraceae bacterium]|nr:sialidase family protein [Nitrospiraceae bacterium]